MSANATPLDQVTPDDNPVFPSRMIAVCQAGHTWPVEVEWAVAHVPGRAPDETMRIPSPQPRFCRDCYISAPGLAAPFIALQHIPRDFRAHVTPEIYGASCVGSSEASARKKPRNDRGEAESIA